MTQPVGVEIILDQPRHLRFDLNGIIDLSDALGVKDPGEFDKALGQAVGSDFRWLRKVLWIGLRHEDSELTEEQTGAIIDIGAMGEINAALTQALQASRPEKKHTGRSAPAGAVGAKK